jgi:putative transposase
VIFRFIAAEKAEHSIKMMCRVLGVSRSGFHAWVRRASSARALEDERLTERIREIHRANRRVYGSPRIHAELVLGDRERVGRKRVERLMRRAGISGTVARKRGRTTIRVPGVRVCEDLVDRAFLAAAPNRLWVADTEVFEYIEVFFNRRRRHSTLGFLSPAQFEDQTPTMIEKITTTAAAVA